MKDSHLSIGISRISKFDGEGPTKAFVDITVNEALVVKGLRIVLGKNGLFVSYPGQQGKDGKWYRSVFPVDKEAGERLSERILAAYEQ